MLQLNLYRNNLSSVVDGVHQLFEQWERSNTRMPRVHEETLVCARIVIHEWMANLIQHGDFEGRAPSITIGITFKDGRATCFVRDNSKGLDFGMKLSRTSEQSIHTMPERDVRLLMLQRCAEGISYDRTGEGDYQLQFSVSARRGRFRTIYAMPN